MARNHTSVVCLPWPFSSKGTLFYVARVIICVQLSSVVFKVPSQRLVIYGLRSTVCSLWSVVCSLQSAICSLQSAVCKCQTMVWEGLGDGRQLWLVDLNHYISYTWSARWQQILYFLSWHYIILFLNYMYMDNLTEFYCFNWLLHNFINKDTR